MFPSLQIPPAEFQARTSRLLEYIKSQQLAGVVLQGTIVDADTQHGIPNAVLGVLKPGVTFQKYSDSGSDASLIVAIATTDVKGFYQTAPPLTPGNKFTLLWSADNYPLMYCDDCLELAPTADGLQKIVPITLSKR